MTAISEGRAFAYENEKEVGEGIRDSGVPREQIWITTKLHNSWHHRVQEAIDASLKNLGVEYVDLYLVHWPSSTDPNDSKKHLPDWDYIKTWLVNPSFKHHRSFRLTRLAIQAGNAKTARHR